jgi:phage terminase large subunit GpA-like protein
VVKGKASCATILGVPWRAEAVDTTGKRAAQRRRRGLVIYPVGTDAAKVEFYGALRLVAVPGQPLPMGSVSIPQVGPAVCRELCAEALVRRRVAGREVERWERIHRPNDALDGALYARAASQCAKWDTWTAADLAAHEAQLGALEAPADAAPPAPPPVTVPPPAPATPTPRVLAPGEQAPQTVTWRRSEYWRGW